LAQAATSHGRQPLLFRVSRITKWEPTRKTGFLTPEERQRLERAKKFQLGGWIEDAEPFEIQVKITGKKWVSAFLERPPGLPEFQIEEVKAKGRSHQIIRFKATEMSGPARWVLQLGPEAEVLSPPEFRAHVADRLHEAAEIYRTGTRA
jgi:predicted DNA-binding transcriptional regulator YafY